MTVKKLFSLILAVSFLLAAMSGCGRTEQDEKFDELVKGSPEASSGLETSSELESKELSGEITFVTLFDDEYSGERLYVNAFNKTHENIKVKMDAAASINITAEGIEKVTEVEDNLRQRLATELMSGEADYIVNDSVLDPTKFAEAGLFYDLFEFMESDPDFKMDDYFKNIFDAVAYDGHLYSLPTSFVFSSVYLNKKITDGLELEFEPLDRITYEDLLKMYEDGKAKGLIEEGTSIDFAGNGTNTRMHMFSVEWQEYIDLPGHAATLDSPEFISLLEKTQEIFTPREPDYSQGYGIPSFAEAVKSGNCQNLYFNRPLTLNFYDEGCTMDQTPEGLVGPLVLVSTNGNVVYNAGGTLSIPKSCTQPELAWEFLKFCISLPDDPQKFSPVNDAGVDVTNGQLPINRECLTTYAKLYDTFSGEGTDTEKKLVELLEDVNRSNVGTGNVEIVVTPIMQEYYEKHLLSAEECARQMQERAEIYLNE